MLMIQLNNQKNQPVATSCVRFVKHQILKAAHHVQAVDLNLRTESTRVKPIGENLDDVQIDSLKRGYIGRVSKAGLLLVEEQTVV